MQALGADKDRGAPALCTDQAMTIAITASRSDIVFTGKPSTDAAAATLAAGTGRVARPRLRQISR